MSAEEVTSVLSAVDDPQIAFDQTGDTVDDAATYLLRVVDEGKVMHDEVFRALTPMLLERLQPYVRAKFDCPTACVADVMIRRYLPTERRRLEAHFDTSSFATSIISLSDASDYVGGIYVQAVPGVASRRFVPLHRGDALVHQFDTMHGVQVPSGRRLSLVVWFSDSDASLKDGNSAPWVERAASEGNAEAMFVLGGFHYRGEMGYARNTTHAAHWLRRAAARGVANAQLLLAAMLAAFEVSDADMDAIEVELAREELAREELARGELARGELACEELAREELAREELAREDVHPADAAEQDRRSEGSEQLQRHGAAATAAVGDAPHSEPNDGAEHAHSRGARLAVALFRRAAALGAPVAQYHLGRAYRLGEGVEADLDVAEEWLRLAADQGADDAASAEWAATELEALEEARRVGLDGGMPPEAIQAAASMAEEWARLSPEEQQQALEEINYERRMADEEEWDMAALRRMMGITD